MRKIYWVEQQTEDWFNLRAGSIGGSGIAKVCAKNETYFDAFVSELITGRKYKYAYTNKYMDMGNIREPAAATYYSMKYADGEVQYPGMVKLDDHRHVSPDFTIGLTETSCHKVGEIKSVLPSTHTHTLRKMVVPSQYRRQCEWEIFICGADSCDFISWCPEYKPMPMIVIPYSSDIKLANEVKRMSKAFIAKGLKERDILIKKMKQVKEKFNAG